VLHRFMQALALTAIVGVCAWVWLAWDHESFARWQEEAGPLPFFVALAIMPAFGLPTTPFYLLAGATFGTGLALAGSAASLAVNLALCYWIARSGVRPRLKRWLEGRGHRLPVVTPGREYRFALVMKLMPGVPTFMKNYLICLSGVPFAVYFTVAFIFTFLYAAAFIVLGDSLYEQDFSDTAWALGGLAVLGLGGWYLYRRAKSRNGNNSEAD
jgi:uncharacterized membrane protein YdjX (TVP38/TMEM64 family)